MINYDKYELEDFLHDDFFISWVLKGTELHHTFWHEWLLSNPERQVLIDQARTIVLAIQIQPLDYKLTDKQVDQAIKKIQQQAFTTNDPQAIRSVKFYQMWWFRVAASLILILSVGFLLLRPFGLLHKPAVQKADNNFVSFVNKTKESELVRMIDGSLAVLTPGSSLKYPKLFNTATRQVYLEGQAFFEVHKNPAKPFLVYSQNMVTRVLGTSFTVRAMHQEKEFKVTVNTGRVMVYQKEGPKNHNTTNRVTLIPNEEATFQREDAHFKKMTLTVPLILSKEVARKEFTFRDATLAEIIKKLNQAYGVNIEYDEKRLGKEILSASLSDRPLDEKVNFICQAINAKCEIADGHIRIIGGDVNPEPIQNQ
jgi:transmembrane sensor